MSLNSKMFLRWKLMEGIWTTSFEGPCKETYTITLSPFWKQTVPVAHLEVKDFQLKQKEFLNEKTWLVEFFDSNQSKDITGKQGTKAARVFGIVGNAILQRAREQSQSIKNLIIIAEENRYSFYKNKYIPLWASLGDKDMFISDDKKAFYLMDKEMPKIRKCFTV